MIFAFARLDVMSWFPRRQTLLPLAFVVVVAIVLPIPGMAIAAAAFVASLMLSAPFLSDERDQLDTLYGVLPISRRAVVLGRSISVLLYGALAVLAAMVATYVVAFVRGDTVAPGILLFACVVAFAIVGLAMAVQLPVLFRVGYSRGRLMVYAPTLLIAGAVWVAHSLGAVEDVDFSALSVGWVAVACSALGVLGITVGVTLAAWLYATREL